MAAVACVCEYVCSEMLSAMVRASVMPLALVVLQVWAHGLRWSVVMFILFVVSFWVVCWGWCFVGGGFGVA